MKQAQRTVTGYYFSVIEIWCYQVLYLWALCKWFEHIADLHRSVECDALLGKSSVLSIELILQVMPN